MYQTLNRAVIRASTHYLALMMSAFRDNNNGIISSLPWLLTGRGYRLISAYPSTNETDAG